MSRLIKAISLLITLVFVFTACQAAEVEIVPEFVTTETKSDLGGFKATWAWNGTEGDIVFGFIPGTANGDRVMQRKKDVENSLNCSITMKYTGDALSILRAGVMSGAQELDLVTYETYFMVVDIRAGYLTGLSALIDVENVEKWGTPNMLQSALWKDDLYGVVPYAWPDVGYTGAHAIAVNEDIVSMLSQPDPREFVENNTWTWDQFEECLTAYTYNDGGGTVYGMQCHSPYFAINMLLSNGVAISSYENGKVACGAYTQAGFVALERAKKIMQETHSDCFHPSNAADGRELFYNRECVMTPSGVGGFYKTVDAIMYKMENVGVLPFPQGPDATPGVYLSYHESLPTCISIPFNAKDTEASAAVLSAMLEPFDDFKTKDDIMDFMAEQIFFDRRDVEVIINLVRNTEYGFFREGARSVIEQVTSTTTPVSSLLEANEKAYDQIVEDYMIPHYQGRIAVYGE